MKLPAIMFYPGDWLRDDVSGCSLAAQGLWLRMMILMHDSDRYGYLSLNGSPIPSESISRRCGCDSLTQYESLLSELINAGVPEVTKEKIIFSRRMVKDEKKRRDGSKYGSLGGNPTLKGGLNPLLKGRSEDEIEFEFLRFYSEYPRKEKPADARKAWVQKAGPIHIEAILAALTWQKKSDQWRKSDGQFVPLPASYLRSESWLNQKTIATSSSAKNGHETLSASESP